MHQEDFYDACGFVGSGPSISLWPSRVLALALALTLTPGLGSGAGASDPVSGPDPGAHAWWDHIFRRPEASENLVSTSFCFLPLS